ncbi:MAG TPA: extracellular solute-binding protein [Candidatus Ventricola intestinavium]|nr:extracellular solute-binding protein [Candidatus Ventricola intestinavium]
MRKKGMVWFAALLVMMGLAGCAAAAGVTLRTFTPFADMDLAAQSYMDLITAWETESGNLVEDYSGLTDEAWMEQLRAMTADGQVDLVVVPVGSGLTGSELVNVEELLAVAPDCGARRMDAMMEADGTVLLTPVRFNWEALYINTDVLEAKGLSAPTTYEELVSVCSALAQEGVLPLANALGDWAEIVLDCAALLGAPADQYGQQASLDGAQAVLTALMQAGAFGTDPWGMTDADAQDAFLSGQAAMRFDSEGLAQMATAAGRQDSVTVVSLAGTDGQARTAVVGVPSFGLALTQACWQDEARREAALSLVTKMLSQEGLASLAGGSQSRLGESIAQLTASATGCTGLLYDLNPDGFESWAQGVIDALRSL